jgi:DNA polymerase III sliding clamp (beta) subunit (PCNA family)
MKLDKAILALRYVVSREETRVNLSGIYLEPTGAVATDGHMLATIEAPKVELADGETEPEPLKPCILANADAEAIAKALPKRSHNPAELLASIDTATSNANGTLKVSTGSATFEPRKVNGEFPDYRQVIPSSPVVFRVSFNADYLASLVKVAKAADGSSVVTLEFTGDKDTGKPSSSSSSKEPAESIGSYDSPIIVKVASAPRFYGVLMPCRI